MTSAAQLASNTRPASSEPLPEAQSPGSVFGTQYSPSDVARGTGYSLSHITRLLSGKSAGSMDSVPEVADFLGLPVDKLIGLLAEKRLAYARARRVARGLPPKENKSKQRRRV